MRKIKVGQFDAIITIFNAVGHLRKSDFEKTMRNIHRNLNKNGIYVFDIINLSNVLNADMSKWSLERTKKVGDTSVRELQHSIIDKTGILRSYTTFYEQKGLNRPKASHCEITLQLYTAKELRAMLEKNRFEVLSQSGMDFSKFSEKESDRILTVARKL